MIWGGGTSICCSFSRNICKRHGMVRYIYEDVGYHSGNVFYNISIYNYCLLNFRWRTQAEA